MITYLLLIKSSINLHTKIYKLLNPRKKMNYLDGLKMLIKEEVSKKHPK